MIKGVCVMSVWYPIATATSHPTFSKFPKLTFVEWWLNFRLESTFSNSLADFSYCTLTFELTWIWQDFTWKLPKFTSVIQLSLYKKGKISFSKLEASKNTHLAQVKIPFILCFKEKLSTFIFQVYFWPLIMKLFLRVRKKSWVRIFHRFDSVTPLGLHAPFIKVFKRFCI